MPIATSPSCELTLTPTVVNAQAILVASHAPLLASVVVEDRTVCPDVLIRWPHLVTELRTCNAIANIRTFTRLESLVDVWNCISRNSIGTTMRYNSVFCIPQAPTLTQLRSIHLAMSLDFDFATEKRFLLNDWRLPHLTRFAVNLATPERFAELLAFILRKFPSVQDVQLQLASSENNSGGLEEQCEEAALVLTNIKPTALRCVRLHFTDRSAAFVSARLKGLSRQLLWVKLTCTFTM